MATDKSLGSIYYSGKIMPLGARPVIRVMYGVDERKLVTPLQLEPSLRIADHSPTGFDWGYEGSGPTQLAIALLLDVTHNVDKSIAYAYEFKRQIVASWGDEWSISKKGIQEFVNKQEKEDNQLCLQKTQKKGLQKPWRTLIRFWQKVRRLTS